MYSLSVPRENEPDENADISETIRRLMEQYGNDVLRTAFMYLRDRQRAEDVFQEVFIKAFRKYDDFRGESSEKTWLIKITINMCRDILRSSWLKRVITGGSIGPKGAVSGIEDRYIRKDENRQIFEEVLSLPPVFREAVIMYYYHGYDTSEISSILGVREGTVRSRLHRAREMLRSKLEGRLGADG
jgi:RNA polymerase sigma-70 factor (ECF subfamily)